VDNVGDAATDEELVRACQAGDRAAFDTLVRRHERQIYGLCFRFVGNHEDASDLAQDAFVRAYRSLSRFKGESAFGTWLYRIAVNVCLNRRALKPAPIEPLADVDRQPSATDPADVTLERQERAARVRRAIARLPEKQRATLVLRAYHDLPHEEIGQVLGTTTGASKANFFHALRSLKRLLDDEQ
jgi:RNA polymerase sigma-70 factor (ECF subfamily)